MKATKIDKFNDDVRTTILLQMDNVGLFVNGQPIDEGVKAIEELLVMGCENYHIGMSLSDCEEVMAINTGRSFTAMDMYIRRTLARSGCPYTLKELFKRVTTMCAKVFGHEIDADTNEDISKEVYASFIYGKNYRKTYRVRNADELMTKADVGELRESDDIVTRGWVTFEGKTYFIRNMSDEEMTKLIAMIDKDGD